MVSCYGRIKSVERTFTAWWGKDVKIRARILKSKVAITTNKTIRMPVYFLSANLNRDGIKYRYTIGRLVYNCFIAPIELSGRSELVSFRDKDGRNTDYRSLYKTYCWKTLYSPLSSVRVSTYFKNYVEIRILYSLTRH